ncbi:hypothetical protein FSBG_01865 [Fusobacterium gonidiaformans 3-1-5R]|uniref:Uncharacterized protein n=2 Tax=Fusobacterium TaxID=848 RepID=E5BIP6_9FUSO|nr:hypothetical protein FSBG_01865 [Fusobacterium gonidiaformans 3-1-5R]KXA13535.1 hypothetical protein HMPREF3206_01437 [Fusobacterium equinum]
MNNLHKHGADIIYNSSFGKPSISVNSKKYSHYLICATNYSELYSPGIIPAYDGKYILGSSYGGEQNDWYTVIIKGDSISIDKTRNLKKEINILIGFY